MGLSDRDRNSSGYPFGVGTGASKWVISLIYVSATRRPIPDRISPQRRSASFAGGQQMLSFRIFHHPFVPEYATGRLVVLDFLHSLRIINVRGEVYAQTWIYS